MNEREELLLELAQVKKIIADTKAEIKLIKTIRHDTGQYESIKVFDNLQATLAKAIHRYDEINAELSSIKTKKQNDFHKHFIDVCREEIDEEDFAWILSEAKKRTEENTLQESATDSSITKPVTP